MLQEDCRSSMSELMDRNPQSGGLDHTVGDLKAFHSASPG
jgi:hypothetical protein